MNEAVSIKTDIKEEIVEEYFSDYKNEIDTTLTLSTAHVKSEEIDIKYEPLEIVRLSSIGNGVTLPVIYSKTSTEDTIPNDMSIHKALNVVDDKTIAINFELECKEVIEKNVSTDGRYLETPMYKCNNCLYKTRRKSCLRNHMLNHTKPSKATMYECNTCPYTARRKPYLQSHMLVHANPSTTPTYECNTCTYKTRRKSSLFNHMVVHADPSKIPMYECSKCPYKSRRKANLKSHMLVHANPSTTPMFECVTCLYKTPRKESIQKHVSACKSF